jgi:hypothetical protein
MPESLVNVTAGNFIIMKSRCNRCAIFIEIEICLAKYSKATLIQ